MERAPIPDQEGGDRGGFIGKDNHGEGNYKEKHHETAKENGGQGGGEGHSIGGGNRGCGISYNGFANEGDHDEGNSKEDGENGPGKIGIRLGWS